MTTLIGATNAPGPVAEVLGKLAFEFTRVQPILPTYLHLLVSALFPIYIGAHASLSCPSSAQPFKADKNPSEEEDDVAKDERKMEGLTPGDAIIFPLTAGITLAGLYVIIKWLHYPALLNMILNGYFSFLGIFSVGKLLGDFFNVITSFIFPSAWRDGECVWQVRNSERRVLAIRHEEGLPRTSSSPLPGRLSRIKLSPRITDRLWALRSLLTEKWTFQANMRGSSLFRMKFGVNDILGLMIGFFAVVLYNLFSKAWWLTNLMGFGFSYGALQLLSPTTFWTGTLILGALFFTTSTLFFLRESTYFEFSIDLTLTMSTYRPLMVTVAMSLDVPIKLLFPRPPAADQNPDKLALSMLGLGDVVLPGLLIGLALRFDLFLFYLRKGAQAHASEASSRSLDNEGSSKPTVDDHKPVYYTATGNFGERYWLSAALYGPKKGRYRNAPSSLLGGNFPKPYFTASMVGYTLGMLTTLGVMEFSQSAQPALLYLAPGVLFAIWGTAYIRGDIAYMWGFVDGVQEEEEKDRDSSPSAEVGISHDIKSTDTTPEKESAKASNSKRREIFSLSITAPKVSGLEKLLVEKIEAPPAAADHEVVGKRSGIEGNDAKSTGLETDFSSATQTDRTPVEKRRRKE